MIGHQRASQPSPNISPYKCRPPAGRFRFFHFLGPDFAELRPRSYCRPSVNVPRPDNRRPAYVAGRTHCALSCVPTAIFERAYELIESASSSLGRRDLPTSASEKLVAQRRGEAAPEQYLPCFIAFANLTIPFPSHQISFSVVQVERDPKA